MSDHDIRLVLRQFAHSLGEFVPLRRDSLHERDLCTKPLFGELQAAIAGLHEAAVVDAARE